MKRFHLKRLVCSLILLIGSLATYAQGDTTEVFELEYFFDIDPGFGSATTITVGVPAINVSTLETLISSGLSTGFHVLGFRARNLASRPTISETNPSDGAPINIKPTNWIDPVLLSNGDWGMTETRLVFVDQSDAGAVINVDQVEYYFDVDPGVGLATLSDPFSPNSSVSLTQSLTTDGLSTGFHVLGMRARAEGGAWGTTETRLIFVDQSDAGAIVNVDQVEYYFDVDPGVGSATLTDSFSPNAIVSLTQSLATSGLSTGFHVLGMRARAEGGAWGTTETRLIFVDQSDAGAIVNVDQIEYYFDEDPGVGSATQISAFPAENLVSAVESLDAASLSLGFHVLGMRARAEGGAWGSTETRLVYVDPAGSITNVSGVEYFIGEDPGVGQASFVSFSEPGPDVSEMVILLGTDTLSLGTKEISFRARDELGSWGLTETTLVEVVSLGAPSLASNDTLTNTSPATVQIAFGEPVNSFNIADLVLQNGSIASFVDNGDDTFTAEINLLDEGLVTLDIPDSAAFAVDDNSPSPAAKTLEIVYDLTAPEVTVDTLSTMESSPALSGSVSDSLAIVEVTIGGTTYDSIIVADSTWTLSAGIIDPLIDGTYDVVVTATDLAGNVGTDTTTNELVIFGNAPPFISIDPLSSNSRSPQLTGRTSETAGTIEITVDGSTYSAINNAADSTWTLPAGTITPDLTDGVYDVIASIDISGEITSDTTTNELRIDGTGPVVTVDESMTNDVSPVLTGSIDDFEATIELTVGGNTFPVTNNGDGTWTLAQGSITPNMVEGTYDVVLTATDSLGNSGSDATTDELTVDLTAPEVTIDVLVTSISSPELTGTINDTTATLELTVNGSNYVPTNNGDGTWSLAAGIITSLTDGVYDVGIFAMDLAGNTGTDITTDELTISLEIITFIPTVVTSTSFEASWSTADDVANYTIDVSRNADFSSFVPGYEALSVPSDQTSVEVSGLDFSTTYYYRVRFTNTNAVESNNSNITLVKTLIDNETIADSLALVEIFAAVNPQGLNWDAGARFTDWDNITLNTERTRVTSINLNATQAAGDLPNPFSDTVVVNSGLSELTSFSATGNELTGLIDFTGTAISTVNVENNHLIFEDLEPLVGTSNFTYAPQAERQFVPETNPDFLKDFASNGLSIVRLGIVRVVPTGESYIIETNLGGTANQYNWRINGSSISGDRYTFNGSSLTINSIAIDNMGLFDLTVTNPDLPDLTFQFPPEYVFATVDITMRLTDFSDQLLNSSERFTGALLETEARESGYDTLANTPNPVGPEFVFEDVILGDYLCGIDPQNREDFIPTYFGDAFEWIEADTIEIREPDTLSIKMTEEPEPPEDGPGSLAILIEEDFGDEEARVDARRRAKRRKCGLRRRRTGGRTGQEDGEFELFAYGETDDNGEFQFGFLPEGTYRFFVEYPGIPLDPEAEVEFEVGEQGISDTEFSLSAFATEGGVEISIDRILGLILTYFKDLEVYPNPSSDDLNIRYRHLKSKNITAELVDLTGQTKWSQDMQHGFDGELTIDVSEYPEGVYILHFYDRNSRDEHVVSYRILIKK